ncbi:MAG: magnesium/cobalt transporter CorA [Candidatus Diapherotrites archaeon]|nr:magnesium/cobalt transporter CorA [Candidatus Diapherotrites archaeon]
MNKVYFLQGKELKEEVFSAELIGTLAKKKTAFWLDLISPELKELTLLQELLGIHPLSIEDLTTFNSRIKLEEFKGYVFLVVYGLSEKLKLHEIDFILSDSFIISSHESDEPNSLKLRENKEKLMELMKKTPDYLMHYLIEMEVNEFFPAIEKIDETIEDFEKRILKNPKPTHLQAILEFKSKITKIRNISLIQRETLSKLTKSNTNHITEESVPFYRDLYDHLVRVAEAVEIQKENTIDLVELYMSVVSNKMNEVMKVLSVIATIMLPLTVITGLYGMNFKILPLSQWEYGFWMIVIIMILISAGMLYFFKRRNWF